MLSLPKEYDIDDEIKDHDSKDDDELPSGSEEQKNTPHGTKSHAASSVVGPAVPHKSTLPCTCISVW